MNTRKRHLGANPVMISTLVLAAFFALASTAHATQADHIKASHAWLRVLPADLPAGAYVTLENTGNQAASLTSASSAAYAQAMLHHSTSEGGTSRMSMVAALPVPAHGKAMLAPGGYHLMLMKAVHPVKAGDTVNVTLTFSDGSTLATPFIARPANAIEPGS